MRFLLILLVLIATPATATAAPVVTAVVGWLGTTVTITATLTVTYGQIAGLLLGYVSNRYQAAKAAKAARRAQTDLKMELRNPSTMPAYRYVYGDTLMEATPVFMHTEGKILYVCYLFNSRPSAGPFEVRIDNRIMDFGGKPYFFGSNGAYPTKDKENATYSLRNLFRFWIGLGDQTQPPQKLLDEIPDVLKKTDAWRNCTVMWIRADIGWAGAARDRWPSQPPVMTMRGKWSTLYDPRVAGMKIDDPKTWRHSSTSALVTLDVLRTNPIEQYAVEELDLRSFADAANEDERRIQLKAGGTEPRNQTHGVVVFNGTEVSGFIDPLFENAAAEPVRVNGKLAILTGVARDPIYEITDFVGDTLEYQPLTAGKRSANTFLAEFTSSDRNYKLAPLEPYVLPTALSEDNGKEIKTNLSFSYCQSATQAMRLQKFYAFNGRAQQTITGTLPHSACELFVGADVTVNLPTFGWMNGRYVVQSLSPLLAPEGDGEAVQFSVTLIRRSTKATEWDHNTDEIDFRSDAEAVEVYDGMAEPTDVDVASGDMVASVNSVVISFQPSTSFDADNHTVERRVSGSTIDWDLITTINTPDGSPRKTFVDTTATNGDFFDYRLTAKGVDRTSEPVEVIGILSSPPATPLIPPDTGDVDVEGSNWTISFVAPDDPDVMSLTFFVSDTAGGTPIETVGPLAATNGARISTTAQITITGTHFVYAIANLGGANESAKSTSIEVTT